MNTVVLAVKASYVASTEYSKHGANVSPQIYHNSSTSFRTLIFFFVCCRSFISSVWNQIILFIFIHIHLLSIAKKIASNDFRNVVINAVMILSTVQILCSRVWWCGAWGLQTRSLSSNKNYRMTLSQAFVSRSRRRILNQSKLSVNSTPDQII